MDKKILGVSRSPRFSPNSVERDEAIFSGVVSELTQRGLAVSRICEDEFRTASGFDAVFSMARDVRVLHLLSDVETRNLPVVNSAKALLKGSRLAMTECFEREGIPVPSSPICFVREGDMMKAVLRNGAEMPYHFPLWLKRSGACAQAVGDVCFVENEEMLQEALSVYMERGIDEVLASEHLSGDLIKFYGVEGTDFFYYYYPTAENTFSKFGLEKINGAPCGYPLDVASLKSSADHAAQLCGILVYGGDCIVDENGQFRIIDFNDWPSYSRCCETAARAIAEKIWQLIS